MGNSDGKPEAPPLPPGYLYHAFISYRRLGGTNHLAALIASELTAHGFKVFFDVDSLQAATFDTAILAALRASCCDVFVLVPGTLDRCFNDHENKDWVRLEIAEACHLGKAILPVVDDPAGFPNTDGLPADMSAFPRHNALMWSFHLKKHCIAELVERVSLAVQGARPFASLPPPRRPSHGPRPHSSSKTQSASAGAQPAELLVAAGASIMDAVRRAGPKQTIRLAPGRYTEGVVLEKEVHIIGPREAVLEWGDCAALHCAGPAAPSVKGITIRNTAPKWAAVLITGGSRATVAGCDVSSAAFNGIEASGEGTAPAPVLKSNVVHGCLQAGITITRSAKGTVEGNDVFGNALSGVIIESGADPVVRSNKVHDGQQCGIFVAGNGRGTVEGNDVFGNSHSGIGIKTGADPVVRRNKVHDGKQAGFYVYENGRGTIEGNDVFGNALAGFQIMTGADPVVRGNKVHDQRWGIDVVEGGKGTVTGNTLERMSVKAINVAPDCTGCRLEGNTVR